MSETFKLNVQWIAATPIGGCKEFNSILSFILKDQNTLVLNKYEKPGNEMEFNNRTLNIIIIFTY